MLCSIVSIVSRLLLHSSSDVRDVDCWVKARLRRRRLLSGRVVGREDGLLGLLAGVHLELARDSLLLGHCGGSAGVYVRVWEREWCLYQSSAQLMSVGARDDYGLVMVVVEVVVSELRVSQRPEGLASQERLRAACKNAVTLAGSGKRSLSD